MFFSKIRVFLRNKIYFFQFLTEPNVFFADKSFAEQMFFFKIFAEQKSFFFQIFAEQKKFFFSQILFEIEKI